MPVIAKIAIVGVLGLLAGLLVSNKPDKAKSEEREIRFVAREKPAAKKESAEKDESDDE